jgi:hypothetical protein
MGNTPSPLQTSDKGHVGGAEVGLSDAMQWPRRAGIRVHSTPVYLLDVSRSANFGSIYEAD